MNSKLHCIALAQALGLELAVSTTKRRDGTTRYVAKAGDDSGCAVTEEIACQDLADQLRSTARGRIDLASTRINPTRLSKRTAEHALRDANARVEELRKWEAIAEQRRAALAIAAAEYLRACDGASDDTMKLVAALDETATDVS